MKKVFLSALVLISGISSAADIEGIRSASPVSVKRVQTEKVGERGFPLTEVTVTATFGNKCEIPTADELVSIVTYTKDYSGLLISLGMESQRVCPQVYAPVTATIKIGQCARPNDGMFSKVSVNQVTTVTE